jgi:hypothetical protein
MTDEFVFNLYKKVQNKDRKAEDLLIDLHRKKFPNSTLYKEAVRGSSSYSRTFLHTMYLNLTR